MAFHPSAPPHPSAAYLSFLCYFEQLKTSFFWKPGSVCETRSFPHPLLVLGCFWLPFGRRALLPSWEGWDTSVFTIEKHNIGIQLYFHVLGKSSLGYDPALPSALGCHPENKGLPWDPAPEAVCCSLAKCPWGCSVGCTFTLRDCRA